MQKLYANENFPLPVVELLRTFGHDVLTSMNAGNANQRIPDEDILKFAISQNRIMITINRRDFIRLHRITPIHSGIIVCKEDADFAAFAQRIHSKLENMENQFVNQLIRIYKSS